MLLGSARVSKSGDQQTAPQIRALKEAGCKKIFEESASGGRWDRPELRRLLGQLRDRVLPNRSGQSKDLIPLRQP